jgi:polyisoprenoid-binding protein YceI
MRSLVALSCLFTSVCVVAAPVAYTLDPAHTQVLFSWNHMQYSNPEGSFDDVTGTLMWDADDIAASSVDVTIAADSLHSHVTALDEKLKSAEFLDARRYPKVRFVSTHVERMEDAPGHLRIGGNLTLHGVTRPVSLDAQLIRTGVYPMLEVPAAGFSASTVIKRSEFGVAEGIPFVGDELRVRISTEALEAVGFANAMQKFAEKAQASK